MNADQVRDTMLSMEVQFLKDQILNFLCRWERVRDDRDLIKALEVVRELVLAEDAPQPA